MAGGRRRGAKGAKTKSELNLGDLVLAKVKGHPAWPAKIGRPEDWDKTPDPKKCFVHFFGTDEIAFVAPADIQEFTSETKNKLAARCKGKTVKYFVTAVREICAAFEELQDKSSSGIGADTDVDELHRDRVQKVTEDHNCELDQCSHRHGEMDYQDIKSDISKKNKIFKEGANYTNKDKLPASSPGNLIGPKKEPMSNDSSKEDTVVPSKPSKMMTGTEGGSKDNSYSEAKGHSSGGGVQDGSSPPPSSVHPKYLDSGLKESINGHKSKKIISGSRRQLQDDAQVQTGAVRSSLPIVSGGNVDINISGEGGVQNRSGSIGGISHSSPNKSRSNMDAPKDQNKKQSLKDKVHLKRAEDLPDSKGTFRKLETGDLTGETKSHLGHGKHKLATDEVSHHAKSFKSADIDMTKGSVQKTRKSGHLENKAGSAEFKRSVLQGNAEDCLVPRDEDVLPPAKRLRQAPEIVVSSSTRMFDNKLGKASFHRNDLLSSDKAKSPVGQYPKKRRAVRLYDDDDDKPKTPVHGGSIFKGDAPSRILGPVKNGSAHIGKASDTLDDGGSSKVSLPTVKRLNESLPSISYKHSEVGKRRQSSNSHIFTSPVKSEFAKRSSEEVRPVRVSPVRSPLPASTVRPVLESPKPNIPLVKVSDNTVHQNSQAGLDKNMAVVPDSLDRTINQGILERNKSIPSVDRKKDASKLSSRASDSVLLTEKTLDVLFSDGDRVEKDKEASREDKTFLPSDLKSEDSALSMKHLIAVAQAKRKEAHSQSFSHGDSFLDVSGGSPSIMFAVPPVQPSSSIQADMQGSYSYSSSTSPASHIRKPSFDNNHDIENFDDRRIGSGHRAVGEPLSGSTEAAVARDAFEGMIETLSRTKESIGRATRLAIDCAKHGIANEVVELLIHKLETESSLHRKIDLFFLVDSITQCSHSQKGIAGASYIPIVQASLPRLLGAAAPPGTGARENRRQCLKVLRLWFERKILPESILRRFMDDIGASNNDDISAGSFLRRPSRAERAVDDPIREMEGMLVDEYGSNATFQLPGFVTSHVFDEEEEEEEELQITQNSCKERADRSPPERNTPVEEAEKFSITPSDRRHCVLEDVDGELEMEDVSVHQKDEKVLTEDAPLETVPKEQGLNRTFDAGLSSSEQFPFPMGSPPSPPGSPPPTPPLPDSPIPVSLPPPPPSSPSPPPPPPPPLPPQVQSHPTPPAGMLPSVIPHPSVLPPLPVLPQHLHSIQSSAPSSSSNLAYQRQDAQLPQLAGNNPHAAHLDVNSRNEMYPQPHPYTNPQAPQPSQQFQTVPLSQRSFHPAPPPQVPSSHFSYSNPIVQQRPQHPYPQPYKLPSHPDAPRQYHTDDKWRMQANEFSTNNQHGPWMNGVRSSLLPVPSYGHEGYFRPPMGRLPPPIPTSFQQSAVNAIPAGPPIAGHVGPQMMPPRPDLSSLGPWKPT